MKILVTNHWLKKFGGSETFTYAFVAQLKLMGHSVDVFTIQPGAVSDKINKLGIPVYTSLTKCDYDVVFANHNTCVETIRRLYNGLIIQTCHGIVPKLEQPSQFANYIVAISKEVFNHVTSIGFSCDIIWNGVNCNRFKPVKPINETLKNVLSLAYDEGFNEKIKPYFTAQGITFSRVIKSINPVWNIETEINKADLVITLGRGAYESMACGRNVLVLDKRPYQDEMGDGLVTWRNIKKLMEHNCSGRAKKRNDSFAMLDEAVAKYSAKQGAKNRAFAVDNLNIEIQTQKYLDLYAKLKG